MENVFTLVIADVRSNYELIQFMYVLAQGINHCNPDAKVAHYSSEDCKHYYFKGINFTEEMKTALATILEVMFGKNDLANIVKAANR